jgi:hypothetical protein
LRRRAAVITVGPVRARAPTGKPSRRIVARVLVVLAAAFGVLALVAGYARHAVVDSDQFANRATAALGDEAVRTLIAARVTDEVLAREQDLIAVRPLLESVTSTVVGSGAFTGLFRSGVRDAHRALFADDQDTLTLTLHDVGVVLSGVLQAARPELADDLRATADVALVTRAAGPVGGDLARTAERIRLLAWLLMALALVCAGGALALAADRRRIAVELGVATAVGGLVLVVALGLGRSAVIGGTHGTDARDATAAVWDAFLGDLRTAAWLLAGAGAVVAAAAASLIRPFEVGALLRRGARAVTAEPSRPALRVLRAGALVAAGLTLLIAPEAVLALVTGAAGVLLIAAGTSAMLQLVYRPRPEPSPYAPAGERRRRPLAAAALATVLVGGAIALFAGTGAATTDAPRPGPCNGQTELCDRPLTAVALPATHNSMSAPLAGWYSAAHEGPIAQQLADGVRGLLIDTHYADLLGNRRLRTDASNIELLERATQDGVSEKSVAAALRLRDRLGFAGEGERGMYLCHTFCELGGTELGSVLDDLHDFLVANPGEVVVVVNQDYITPEDFAGAVREAGLERYAFSPPEHDRWPTLRRMIDSGRRLVLLAENDAGDVAPWYRPAYDALLQETPFAFARASQLTDPAGRAATCGANRGPDSAPLFLVNHWVTTDPLPRPSDADAVNDYEPLLARLEECRRVRRHMPNLVAVNFSRPGDVYRAVDALNGIDGAGDRR